MNRVAKPAGFMHRTGKVTRLPGSGLRARASTARWPPRTRSTWWQPADAAGMCPPAPETHATSEPVEAAQLARALLQRSDPGHTRGDTDARGSLWRRCRAVQPPMPGPTGLIGRALGEALHALQTGSLPPWRTLADIQRQLMHRMAVEGRPAPSPSLALLPLVYLNMLRPRLDRQRRLAAQRLKWLHPGSTHTA